jgi:hypothetical protein
VTDFKETELRHRCRNPRCRSKLPVPVSNEREAFCARGCYNAFYRTHCRVCEAAIEQPQRGERILCKRPKCRTAWDAKSGFGRYAPFGAESIAEVPANQALLSAPKARNWRIIAGPALTASQLHCATVPDGPDCQWADGSYERIEAQNRKLLDKHFAKLKADEEAEIEANGYFTDPEWREVISPDGVLCYVTRFRPATVSGTSLTRQIPGDLSIPDFLLRQPPQQFAEAA